MEILLSELMGVTPEPADSIQLPARLLTSLDDARTALAGLRGGIQ
jgi:hypothetical protein